MFCNKKNCIVKQRFLHNLKCIMSTRDTMYYLPNMIRQNKTPNTDEGFVHLLKV